MSVSRMERNNTMTTTTETKAPTKREVLLASIVTITEKGERNPKKPGSMSFARYQGYFAAAAAATAEDDEGTFTVADAYAHGVRGDDIRHDQEHGFITLTPAS